LPPVHQHVDGKWYWYDESWTDECGPYDTQAEAQEACLRYCREELGAQ